MKGMVRGMATVEGRFDGMANGTIVVPAGATAEIAGMVNGSVVVEAGAEVLISGMVNGPVIDRGGRVRVTGIVD